MANNTNLRTTTQKSLFPALISSAHELYSVDSETHKYTLRKSTIEHVLSSVEEKNKSLKIATVGIIACKNTDRHKVYTDLLIQYLENRLQTNEKLVEKFVKDFDEQSKRQTSSLGGIYFWPKIYTITSKKKERCRLLILFFDGRSNRTLDILASAICSQMYVFKEVGKNILATELHSLRDSFTKTSNITLRSPCTTVIKSENDPPRSFRMFLKDWVDFRLDFFMHKETMFNDWEQLMRYLVKTESAINAYISRTELRLISNVHLLPLDQKRKLLPEKVEAGPNLGTSGPSSSNKLGSKFHPLPSPIPVKLIKADPPKKPVQSGPLSPATSLENKVQKQKNQQQTTHLIVKEKEKTKHPHRYHPVSTEDLLGTIKVLLYTWIATKLNSGNVGSILDCCTDLLSFDKNDIFDELAHLKSSVFAFNSEIGNMFDHHVSFQDNDKERPLQQKCEDVQQNLHKELHEKCPKHFELISYLFTHACQELKYQYGKDNELITLHETNHSKRVGNKVYNMYRRMFGQNVNQYQFYEQAVAYHEKLKTFCTRAFARCLDYDSRNNHVLYNETILLTKTLDNYFQLVCDGIPWTKSKPSLANKDDAVVVRRINDKVNKIGNESDFELHNLKEMLISQCESITTQLENREVTLRPLTRKVIEESIKRAHDIANEKLSTKDMLTSETNEIKELVLEYGFKKI